RLDGPAAKKASAGLALSTGHHVDHVDLGRAVQQRQAGHAQRRWAWNMSSIQLAGRVVSNARCAITAPGACCSNLSPTFCQGSSQKTENKARQLVVVGFHWERS
ncbi:hypothetical protein, partial [Aquabacterium sp.]|uniref:hypothetical protein n=1 Tax=Aquabacterium sp. TaxID=1872578 RepID=UPI003D6D6AE5